jgi:CubicO group peptidase (beta-lactamase class C family)
MPFSRRALLAGGTALAAATFVHAADRKRLDAARAVVQELLAADPIPALSIAVMRGSELAWAEAFGKVVLELDVPATASHRFRLGSV